MSYSDFTLATLQQRFGIAQQYAPLFLPDTVRPLVPSEMLLQTLHYGMQLPRGNEKAKSENIISPILREIAYRNRARCTPFSGYALNVDRKQHLTGVCDYLFALKPYIAEPEAPIFCLVEAKKGAIEDAYGQCGAEMIAARMYNASFGKPISVIYGCVTNADTWSFLKLHEQTLNLDTDTYSLKELGLLLGVLQHIINSYPSADAVS